MKFWDIVKEVSANPIRQDADKVFVLAFAGDEEHLAAVREVVLAGAEGEALAEAQQFVFFATPPYAPDAENRLRYADLLVSLPGGPGLTDFRPAEVLNLEEVPSGPELLKQILKARPELRVRLARRLPAFRRVAAEQVMLEVSLANAEFAALAGVTTSIPLLAPLLPAVAGTDIFMLTKNQVMMIYRLAAIYGEDLSVKARLREVAPVVGGAFGWRTLARQLAGVVPGPVGLTLKAGIAFSGTYAVGRAAQMVFDEGKRPTKQDMLSFYDEAGRLAKSTLAALKEKILGKKDAASVAEDPILALPPPRELVEVEEPLEAEAEAEAPAESAAPFTASQQAVDEEAGRAT